MSPTRVSVLLAASLTVLAAPARAADPNRPQGNQGIAPKFTHPTPTKLTTDEEAMLAQAQAVRKQIRYANTSGGRGIAIMDVHATPEQIWKVILDFSSYPEWIDHLEKCRIYKREGNHIYVDFVISAFGLDVEYYIDHTYNAEAGYMTWTLDYARTSDIEDSTGYWLVYPVPGKDGWSRVEYTVDLRVKSWVPDFVQNMLANQGLEKATSWVKKQAEAG